jgi:hypothetical protein
MIHHSPQPFRSGAEHIRIQGLYKAAVLKALYDFARPTDPAWSEQKDPLAFTVEDARDQLLYGSTPYQIDYLNGRPIFCDLSGSAFDPTHYNAHNGAGRAERAVATLYALTWRRVNPFETDPGVQ